MNYSQKFFAALSTGQNALAVELLDENPELVNMRGKGEIAPLHLVAQTGNLQMADVLISRGANLEAVCSSIGSTPLKYAIFFANIQMVKKLLKAGADLNNRGANQRTPLQLAEDATSPMFREMGTPGSDLDYARIANILRSRVSS